MSTQGKFLRFVITSFILFAFIAVGYVIGQRGLSPMGESVAFANAPMKFWESATSGRQMSLATGRINQDGEAVFALDHLTGDLFCWIVSPSDGTLAPNTPINVSAFLNLDGDADYMLCTGLLDLRGGRTGGDKFADSIVYVGDGNSGKVAAFTVLYGSAGVRLEPLPSSTRMMTRDPRTVRDQGNSK